MIRFAAIAVALAALSLSAAPSMAVTSKEKMVTCKFGADNQKLKGTARKSFLSKCMEDPDAAAKPAKTAKVARTTKKPAAAPTTPAPATQ